MLVFDRHSLRCVVPPTDDCDAPATPAPNDDPAEAERGQRNIYTEAQASQPQQSQQQNQQQQKLAGRPRN
ncbi:CLUMA_CG010995, isoform A [Clunio marinus]|uniref:CLUMA_CG010995, isoform A n=1 Tax=Clunio marinus TaxID=568069 RepID=A0A1J1IGN7_9DIPT|nr:CLUMA_CG010995, isoform A [Clunio marinus]